METVYDGTQQDPMSRRNFLAGLGTVAAGAAVAAVAHKTAYADEVATGEVLTADAVDGTKIFEGVNLSMGHLVHSEAKCTGCRDCEIICSLNKWGVVDPELSNIRINTDILGGYISEAEMCKQCPGAECLTVCPTGALHVDEKTGARVIDTNVCIGCQLCLNACPVEPSRIHYSEKMNVCFKCDLCGGEPLCITYCSNEALTGSWVDIKDDPNTVITDMGAPLTLALTGAVLATDKEAVEVTDLNAHTDSKGIKVTGNIVSAYNSPFDAKIKTTFFDGDDQMLHFSERLSVHVDVNATASFEDSFDTSDPDQVKRMRIEIMCGKISG